MRNLRQAIVTDKPQRRAPLERGAICGGVRVAVADVAASTKGSSGKRSDTQCRNLNSLPVFSLNEGLLWKEERYHTTSQAGGGYEASTKGSSGKRSDLLLLDLHQ